MTFSRIIQPFSIHSQNQSLISAVAMQMVGKQYLSVTARRKNFAARHVMSIYPAINTYCTHTTLRALCIDCHRKEPSHEHMRVRSNEVHTINKLRRSQSILSSQDWDDALAFADTSYNGLLDLYRSKNMAVPEIGFDVTDENGVIVATAELAWPKNKRAIIHQGTDILGLEKAGWTVKMLGDALSAAHELPSR
jgi:hypothetical protein